MQTQRTRPMERRGLVVTALHHDIVNLHSPGGLIATKHPNLSVKGEKANGV